MRITVIGAGYVGLVAAVCFAHRGQNVVLVEKDQEKLNKLKNFEVPFYEPGLKNLLEAVLHNEKLVFTADIKNAVIQSDVIFMCVGTPEGENGDADLTHFYAAVKSFVPYVNGYKVIVNKSTVPIGTANIVSSFFLHDVDIVSNPEFLREGSAVEDFLNPERVVIGTESLRAFNILSEIYSSFIERNKIIRTSVVSAEMSKYACNSFLATKISFVNELANLADRVGANIDEIVSVMGTDSRIGSKFLNAGIGYGGSCFPKDVKALLHTAEKVNSPLRIVEAAEQVNAKQVYKFIAKVKEKVGTLTSKNIAVWGLAFKPKTDDIRESPGLKIAQFLVSEGAYVKAYDPKALENAEMACKGNNGLVFCSKHDTLKNTDILIIATEWDEFKADPLLISQVPFIFDGRNIFKKSETDIFSGHYSSVGRGSKKSSGIESMK